MEGLCTGCLEEEALCSGCAQKVKTGAVSQAEVDLQRVLWKLSEKVQGIEKAVIEKVIELDDSLIIITDKKHIGALIGRRGRVVRTLSKKLKKRVRIMGVHPDIKTTLREAFLPGQVEGINIVYRPGGRQSYKVVLSQKEAQKVPTDLEALEKLLRELTKEDILIEVED